MWFEGYTNIVDFPNVLKDALLTAGWQQVPSKIGNNLNDDGYVFTSNGESGTDKITIGWKNAFYGNRTMETDTVGYWCHGYQFFVTEKFTPGQNGQNGTFKNRLSEYHRFCYQEDVGSIASNKVTRWSFKMKYHFSINKNRIIIVTYPMASLPVSTNDMYKYKVVTYVGLIRRFADEDNSDAAVIATSHPIEHAAYSMRMLRDGRRSFGETYVTDGNAVSMYSYGQYGSKPVVLSMPIFRGVEGPRGELDGMLFSRYSEPTNLLPNGGEVIVDGERYLCVMREVYQTGVAIYNNFASAGYYYNLLIKKE